MKLKKNIIMTAMIVATSACTAMFTSSCEHKAAPALDQLATDSISYTDSLTVGSCNAYCTINMQYPADGPEQLVDSLRTWIAMQLATTPMGQPDDASTPDYSAITDGQTLAATAATTLLGTARNEFEFFSADGISVNYEYQWNIVCSCDSAGFVTYSSLSYAYLGGAHGSSSYAGTTFAKSDGTRFTADNMFIPDSIPAVTAMVRGSLMQDFFAEDNAESLLIQPDQISLPAGSPYFTADGIDFTYQQYEIAVYAAGMPSCTIPYDRIMPMLTPQARAMLTAH